MKTIELKAGCNTEQTLESFVTGILAKIREKVMFIVYCLYFY